MKFILLGVGICMLFTCYQFLAFSARTLMSASKVKEAEDAPLSNMALKQILNKSHTPRMNVCRGDTITDEDIELLNLCVKRYLVNVENLSLTYPEKGNVLGHSVLVARNMENYLNDIAQTSGVSCGRLMVTPESRSSHVNFYITVLDRQLFSVSLLLSKVLKAGERLAEG